MVGVLYDDVISTSRTVAHVVYGCVCLDDAVRSTQFGVAPVPRTVSLAALSCGGMPVLAPVFQPRATNELADDLREHTQARPFSAWRFRRTMHKERPGVCDSSLVCHGRDDDNGIGDEEIATAIMMMITMGAEGIRQGPTIRRTRKPYQIERRSVAQNQKKKKKRARPATQDGDRAIPTTWEARF